MQVSQATNGHVNIGRKKKLFLVYYLIFILNIKIVC